MKYLKLFFVVFFMLIALVVLTLGRFLWISRRMGPGGAVDVVWLLYSPWYLLASAAIVALAAWVCRRWVFVS
jgi:hypothetical protein